MPTPRATTNQKTQIAVETTPGTAVPANKLLNAFTWTLGLKPTTKQFRGTGRQYPSASAVLTEQSAGKIAGPGDFAELVYPFSSLWGSGSPAAHAPSITAFDWIWTPSLTASYATSAKTFTVEQGDAIDAEKYAFVTFTGVNYSINRKQELTIGGDLMAQSFTDGITMTASPTSVQQIPMTGAQFNIYLDTTSAGIGATQLTDVMKFDYKASDYYDGYWPINRAAASYTNILDKEKKHEVTLTVQANSTGIGFKANYLETGARAYIRVAGTGPLIDVANSVAATFTHDMACFVTNMAEFADEEGVYAVQYTLALAEDTAWNTGTAQKITLTNLVSAL